jgi:phytoene dehydrogenase-like protein
MTTTRQDDVLVIGGGLAGLTCAALIAREGRRVTVLEKASTLGGRGATHVEEGGYALNLGPHALYRGGAAATVLRELGVGWRGAAPSATGGYALDRGGRHALPGGLVSLLTTGLFGVAAKMETARMLAGLARVDASALHGVTVNAWLAQSVRHEDVRRLLRALFRLATYANAADTMSAAVAVSQLQLALAKNVEYLDGGWQTLVDGVRAIAEAAGAVVRTGAPVTSIDRDASGAACGISLRDGTRLPSRAVVLALPADAAAMLLPEGPARRRAAAAVPVRAACLDVALTRLPAPAARFALGVDRPLYFSLHTAVAKLAPEGGAVIHVARYLEANAPDPRVTERELEGVLDLMQPGWRDVVAHRRYLPSMLAVSALATAADGGLPGRPGVEVADVANLALAGDWIGREGWLVDASVASARAAAAHLTARLGPAARAA